MRFTALGDSLTVGLGDPVVEGGSPTLLDSGWRGWAGLLAEALDGVELRNIACCGAQARDVAASQLPQALAMSPAVASVIVGMNDTLRGAFSIEQIARDLSTAVGALARTGAVVLTARLPDPGRVLGVPELVARPLARRIYAINAVVDELAARHRTVHLDFVRHPEVEARSMWGVDRLHPSERGHRVVARLYAEQLAAIGLPVRELPEVEPTNPVPARWGQTRWLATAGTAWAARRSRDLLPTLARLVAREWWYEQRGRVAELDDQLHAELAAVNARTQLSDPHELSDRGVATTQVRPILDRTSRGVQSCQAGVWCLPRSATWTVLTDRPVLTSRGPPASLIRGRQQGRASHALDYGDGEH